MEPRYRLRLYLLTGLVVAGLLALLTRLLDFQITRRDDFLRNVPGNRIVTVREPGVRGEITDRNGIPLATNLRKYEVSFNLDEIYNAYRQQHRDVPKHEKLVMEGGMPRKGQERDIVSIVKESVIERLKDYGLAKNFSAKALKAHYLTHGGLVPFTYSVDLTYDEFAKFAEHNLDLPGVYIDTRPQRVYPYGTLASHVLGYLKQWEKGDIPPDAARRFDHYIGEEKGIDGIEATQDSILRGPEGVKTMIKDEKGRITGMLDYTRSGDGARVALTLDARVQYLTENVLRRAGRAAAVVMDVNTGEVIAMASVPDYDPNAFIPSIKSNKWLAYNSNASDPFLNRGIAGFTPGSTFKIPTAIAGATKSMASRTFNCNGYVPYGNHKIGCWIWNKNGGSHGAVNLPKAIQQSCNPYFNQMANAVGASAMVNSFEMLNFGKATGIELPEEDPGILPGSRTWLQKKRGETLTPVNQAFLSIGQGDSSATPLQLCAMTACIANGGKYYQPRIVKRAVRPDGKVEIDDKPKLQIDLLKEGVKSSDIALIHKGMWMAVNEAGGTAGRAKLPTIQVAAKTGTAQTMDNGKKSNNSWTIAFAPYDQPKYAVCVMVQAGKGGGKVCGPLVNLILSGLFARDEGLKLPLQKQTEYGGHTHSIEEIPLPNDVLAAIDATDAGETGEEAGDAIGTGNHDSTAPRANPAITPTITPEVDDEGAVIPRAVPVKPNER